MRKTRSDESEGQKYIHFFYRLTQAHNELAERLKQSMKRLISEESKAKASKEVERELTARDSIC